MVLSKKDKPLDIAKQKAKRKTLKLINLKASLELKKPQKRLVWEEILSSPMATYLNQIWKYKVLSAEEQKELWRRIQKWDMQASKTLF